MPYQPRVHDRFEVLGSSSSTPPMTGNKSSSSLEVDRSALYSPSWSKSASYPPLLLSHIHLEEALAASEDRGATLMFMKKSLTDIGSAAAEEIAAIGNMSVDDECCVERIALGSNHLTALPMEFALLSRLRYLNLKGNCFTVFPEVLTLMPSLDTLDISYNKIKRLPARPGGLLKLKVFCISRNKISRLPEYFSKLHQLSVLEVERNPIEWPPRAVMDRPSKFSTPEAMKDWIHALQGWIEKVVGERDDSGLVDVGKPDHNLSPWSGLPLSEAEFDEGVTPHARSFSIDSNLSTFSSVAESDIETPSSSFGQLERPPPLHLGMLQPDSSESSPTRSFESYLPSPANSDTFPMTEPTAPSSPDALSKEQQHGRNASYASGTRSTKPLELVGKKSMPDLRTARFPFAKRSIPELPLQRHKTADEFSIPSPLSQRQDSGSSASSGYRTSRPFGRDVVQASPSRVAPSSVHPSSITYERNSYFRRLSSLPISTISDTMPMALLAMIDCARSILFAVSQVYQTLEHYTIYAIDERSSSVLRKLLDPASGDMMQLINSLDRYDTISRKTVPPPSVCRGVIKSCRDTVAVFGKAVSVLSLQLKAISAGDDARYVRSMILVLYGAAAEVSWAWQAMAPHIEAIKPLLRTRPHAITSPNNISTMGADAYSTSTPSASQSPADPPHPLPSLRQGANERVRVGRRHAGSFSMKDVEIGKALPSYDDVPLPPLSRAMTAQNITSALRGTKRQATLASMTLTVSSPSPTMSSPGETSRAHSRMSSQNSSPSSSPTMTHRTPILDLSSSSKTQVDKEALQAVQNAVDVAPTVWHMMEDVLDDVLEAQRDMRECLDRARYVTQRLAEVIQALKEGDTAVERGALRDDAHLFLKCVVQLSNVVKTYNGSRSNALRNHMYKLTNSTEEFAILLHVSSFAPSSASSVSTPRPYSPMLPPTTNGEDRLTMASLSRARSAQAHGTFKLPHSPAPPEGSKSAQPMTQTFKVPVIRRLRGKDLRDRVDINDPG